MREFILSEITRVILEQTHVIFGTIKEGIMEIMQEHLETYLSGIIKLLDERLMGFRAEITAGQLGA